MLKKYIISYADRMAVLSKFFTINKIKDLCQEIIIAKKENTFNCPITVTPGRKLISRRFLDCSASWTYSERADTIKDGFNDTMVHLGLFVKIL